jgi:ABC-type nickel/cobalt efflux system permease component RcnA
MDDLGDPQMRLKQDSRWLAIFCAALVAACLLPVAAHAANSLGLGAPEQAIKPEGMFASFLMWIQEQQQGFYKLMTGELRGMRQDGSHVFMLIALSFAYGVFHAAGPGHGKAVISSYMLANELAARRGIVLSFASAFVQALTAIIVIAILSFVLRGAGLRMADATRWLEIVSFAGVTLLGAWLLWSKITGRGHSHGHAHGHSHGHADKHAHAQGDAVASAHAHGNHAHDHSHAGSHDHSHGHGHASSRAHAHAHAHAHEHVRGEACTHDHAPDHAHGSAHAHAHGSAHVHAHDHDHGHDHGHDDDHLHAADPKMLSQKDFGLRQAWSAILAVGLRPCSGALIVLTFAFLNGLYFAGIAATFAMAVGTGLTVAVLAALAVWAKDAAIRIGGAAERGATIHRAIEIGGAAMVFLFGLTLLLAAVGTGNPSA